MHFANTMFSQRKHGVYELRKRTRSLEVFNIRISNDRFGVLFQWPFSQIAKVKQNIYPFK